MTDGQLPSVVAPRVAYPTIALAAVNLAVYPEGPVVPDVATTLQRNLGDLLLSLHRQELRLLASKFFI